MDAEDGETMSARTHRPIRTVAPAVAAASLLCLLVSGCATVPKEGPEAGQEVAFFPSVASVSNGNQWSLTVQGRIFEPAEDSQGRQALITGLATLLHADPKDKLFRERAGYFLSDSSGNTRVSVRIADRIVPLSSSNDAGYFTSDIQLPGNEVAQLAKGGVVSFASMPTGANPRSFTGTVRLVPEQGRTVITDIDDTIKVTNIRDSKEKVANTFLRPFAPVPGMPELYRSWKEAFGEDIQFHVVSAGPWQFNEPLRRFFEQEHFPPFTWDMRSIDIGGNIAVDMREASPGPDVVREFKITKIRTFMTRFPKRSVVLVGDSGEQDPEVYSKILSEFPGRVDAVFIHDVTGEDQTADRYKKLFPGTASDRLRVFRNPSELPPLTPISVGNPAGEGSRH
jgi:phosphatidate phosphatase APP1